MDGKVFMVLVNLYDVYTYVLEFYRCVCVSAVDMLSFHCFGSVRLWKFVLRKKRKNSNGG